MAERRDIGLKAIKGARDERSRGPTAKLSGPAWLALGGAVASVLLVAWLVNGRMLSKQKEELLGQQRAAVTTVGAEWGPLRDRIEAITREAAGPYAGDVVLPEAATWDFRKAPAIYLRLRESVAKDTKELRETARTSQRDGFTGCLFRQSEGRQVQLAKGEEDAGTGAQDQPWNLRQAYAATRVLTDAWAKEVRDAEDELRVRVFVQQYEKAKTEDIPLAIDIVKRAQAFVLVLDEDVPEALPYVEDAGAITMEALQQVPHPARVQVVDLRSGKTVLRIRRTPSADFVMAGESAVTSPETRAAMRRQVNNCALAEEVQAAIGGAGRPAK